MNKRLELVAPIAWERDCLEWVSPKNSAALLELSVLAIFSILCSCSKSPVLTGLGVVGILFSTHPSGSRPQDPSSCESTFRTPVNMQVFVSLLLENTGSVLYRTSMLTNLNNTHQQIPKVQRGGGHPVTFIHSEGIPSLCCPCLLIIIVKWCWILSGFHFSTDRERKVPWKLWRAQNSGLKSICGWCGICCLWCWGRTDETVQNQSTPYTKVVLCHLLQWYLGSQI